MQQNFVMCPGAIVSVRDRVYKSVTHALDLFGSFHPVARESLDNVGCVGDVEQQLRHASKGYVLGVRSYTGSPNEKCCKPM
jgi:hypothetical protein